MASVRPRRADGGALVRRRPSTRGGRGAILSDVCCFSPVSAPFRLLDFLLRRAPTVHVANTRIFARRVDEARQGLVYAMDLSVGGDVAMILPLPVVPGSGDHALEFVSLEDEPRFFDDLRDLFDEPPDLSDIPRKGGLALRPQSKLVVHQVGSFEASYVPDVGSFDRLDPRFRLPTEVWSRLGGYADHGFAVFKLNAGAKKRIHPMAFRFATRDPERLFFPTVHVHDGEVHPEASFDHQLFWQGRPGATHDLRSAREPQRAAHGLLAVGEPVLRRDIRGMHPNQDTWV
jgi:hypothetical protein